VGPVGYSIEEADQVAFNALHFRGSVPRFVLFATLTVGAIMALAYSFDGAMGALSVCIGGVIGIALMLAIVRYITVPRFARKAWRDFALIREPMTLTLHEEGFTLDQPSAHVDGRWSNMIAWDEDVKVFAIYVTRQQAYILPKDQIEADIIDYARARLIDSGLIKRGKRRI